MAHGLQISTALMSQILAGDRHLTGEQSFRLANYLGLSKLESDYLTFMIQYERAGAADYKSYWKSKLDEIREHSLNLSKRMKVDRELNEQDRTIFYSSPLYSAIHLFTSLTSGGVTLTEICERFHSPRSRVVEILRFLVETGFCREAGGRFTMSTQKTHLEQGSPHLSRHHTNWRIQAAKRSEELTPEELMYTVQVSLSQKDFHLLREKMVVFIQDFLAQVHESPPEEIAAFNMDFFWINRQT